MLKAWLVINTFTNLDKLKKVYKMLQNSFIEHNINLEIKKAIDIGLDVDLSLSKKPHFVIFWDKDIYLAKRLEQLGCKLFNSSDAIELCDNKILMYQKLQEGKIRIPKTYILPKTFEHLGYTNLSFIKDIVNKIGLPIVIKEAHGSFGYQVYLAKTIKKIKEIINKIGYKDCLIQEFIKESCGRDVRINVVGNKAIISMLRVNNNDFRSNIGIGGKGISFKPKQSFIDLAIKATKLFKLDFAGVDVMFDKNNQPIICELNSNPLFIGTFKVTKVDLSKYIAKYIVNKMK